MFEYQNQIAKTEIKTTFGSVGIKNISFNLEELTQSLPEIVFEDENLIHMFATPQLTTRIRRNIYKRFIPRIEMQDELMEFVERSINANKSFYSFLAEGILGLVYRDIYGYQLAKGVIDITETLTDSHTGADACMYSIPDNIIVLGEAKFYESLNGGMSKIIDDFINNNIRNKIESIQAGIENHEGAYDIVIKNLEVEEYEELTLECFMRQRMVFAGFVLHSETDISQYQNDDFYDKFCISTEALKNNIAKALNKEMIHGDYEIILIHLPVRDKKELIVKIMELAKAKLNNMGNLI